MKPAPKTSVARGCVPGVGGIADHDALDDEHALAIGRLPLFEYLAVHDPS